MTMKRNYVPISHPKPKEKRLIRETFFHRSYQHLEWLTAYNFKLYPKLISFILILSVFHTKLKM